jgi:hypothetical protein
LTGWLRFDNFCDYRHALPLFRQPGRVAESFYGFDSMIIRMIGPSSPVVAVPVLIPNIVILPRVVRFG